jgi:hypothetical protein
VQSDRTGVGRIANHGQQLAHAGGFGLQRQFCQQLAPYAHAACAVGHINRVLGREAVGRAWLEPVGIGKAQNLPFFFGHEPRQTARQHVRAACRHVGFGGWIDLECARAVQHMVLVNGSDGGNIAVGAGTNIGHERGKWI